MRSARPGWRIWSNSSWATRANRLRVTGPIDFVLLDLWKDLYIPCFDLFDPKLGSGAMIVADNMLFPDYRAQTPPSIASTSAQRRTYSRCCCQSAAVSN